MLASIHSFTVVALFNNINIECSLCLPGTFCRITDAVKGPFYPSPPPMPTYVFTPSSPGEEEDLSEILIPKGEVDALKGVEHPNPIQY